MYIEKFNGGLCYYCGEDFMVELCGVGSDDQWCDQICLCIFDEQGQWCVVCYFIVYWGGYYFLFIDYVCDYLVYFDVSEGEDEEFVKVVVMFFMLVDWLSICILLLDQFW